MFDDVGKKPREVMPGNVAAPERGWSRTPMFPGMTSNTFNIDFLPYPPQIPSPPYTRIAIGN